MGHDATRIVLLGASNLQMGAGSLIGESLRAVERAGRDGPADVFVAAGHGRSYGEWTRVLARGLPGIVGCGLWPALAAGAAEASGFGLLTDVGNDLAYGSPPELVAGWVETCLARLRERGLRVAMSLFPEESVARLDWPRFLLLRSVLFPGRRFSHAGLLARGAELNARLRELARRFDVACVAPAAGWFGLDAIHLRPAARVAAWRVLIGAAGAGERPSGEALTVRLGGARPELRTLFGAERRAAQPSVRLPDGGSVSFF